jgi:hypothetical protein
MYDMTLIYIYSHTHSLSTPHLLPSFPLPPTISSLSLSYIYNLSLTSLSPTSTISLPPLSLYPPPPSFIPPPSHYLSSLSPTSTISLQPLSLSYIYDLSPTSLSLSTSLLFIFLSHPLTLSNNPSLPLYMFTSFIYSSISSSLNPPPYLSHTLPTLLYFILSKPPSSHSLSLSLHPLSFSISFTLTHSLFLPLSPSQTLLLPLSSPPVPTSQGKKWP